MEENNIEATAKDLKNAIEVDTETDSTKKVDSLLSSLINVTNKIITLLDKGYNKAKEGFKRYYEPVRKEFKESKKLMSIKDYLSTKKDQVKEKLPDGSEIIDKVKEVAKLSQAQAQAPPSDEAIEKKEGKLASILRKAKESGSTIAKSLVESVASTSTAQDTLSLYEKLNDKLNTIIKERKKEEESPSENTQEESKTSKGGSFLSKLFRKTKPRVEEQTDESTQAKTTWEERADRMKKRKEEVEEEKKKVKELSEKDKKKKEEGSWLFKILGAIGAVAGTLSKVIGGSIIGLGKVLLKLVVPNTLKGILKIITELVPFLAGGIASKLEKGLGGIITSSVKWLGRVFLTREGLKGIGKAGGAIAGGLWQMGKRAAIAALPWVGRAAAVLTGPVGWVIGGALTAYGAYKAYKYFTRNNIADNIYGRMTYFRLLSYGLDISKKDNYYRILKLEEALKDYMSFFNNKSKLKPIDDDLREKIFDIFSIDPKNEAQIEVLNEWFTKRFLPIYRVHYEALNKARAGFYFDELEKLTKEQLTAYLQQAIPPAKAFEVKYLPFPTNNEITVKAEDIEVYRQRLLKEIETNNLGAINPKDDKAPVKDPNVSKQTEQSAIPNQKSTLDKTNPAQAAKEVQKTAPINRPITQAIEREKLDKQTTQSAQPPQATPAQPQAPQAKELPSTYTSKESDTVDNFPKNYRKETVTVTKNPYLDKYNKEDTSTKSLIAKPDYGKNIQINKAKNYPLDNLKLNIPAEKVYAIEPEMFDLLIAMAKEYHEKTGRKLVINSAFRTQEDQARIAREKGGVGVAKPGRSLHEFGLAVDISSNNAEELDKLGLMKKYGFTRPLAGEAWHIENTGVSVNPNRAKTDPQFRKEAIISSPGRGGGGYFTIAQGRVGGRNINYQQQVLAQGEPHPEVLAQAREKLKNTTSGDEAEVASANTLNKEDGKDTSTNKAKALASSSPTATQALIPKQEPITVASSATTLSDVSSGLLNNTTEEVPTKEEVSATTQPQVTKPTMTSALTDKPMTNVASSYRATTQPAPTKVNIPENTYQANQVKEAPKKEVAQITPIKVDVFTKPMEDIMTNQLSTLKDIYQVLQTLTNKMDFDKLAQSLSQAQSANLVNQPNFSFTQQSQVPFQQPNSLNLKRKLVEIPG